MFDAMKPITESYCKHKGYSCTNMSDENVLLPFFLADSAYLIYAEQVKPLGFKRELKLYAKRFIDAYNRFTKDFFSAFDEEQKEYVIEKMDALYALLSYDVEVFRMAIINQLATFPVEVRQRLASLSALMHLVQCAWIAQRHTFSGMQNKELQGMMSATHSLFQAYANQKANRVTVAELNEVPAISASSRVLCNRILKFINLTKEANNGEV